MHLVLESWVAGRKPLLPSTQLEGLGSEQLGKPGMNIPLTFI